MNKFGFIEVLFAYLMKDLLVFKKLVERLNGGWNGTFLGGGAITMSR